MTMAENPIAPASHATGSTHWRDLKAANTTANSTNRMLANAVCLVQHATAPAAPLATIHSALALSIATAARSRLSAIGSSAHISVDAVNPWIAGLALIRANVNAVHNPAAIDLK